MASAPDSPGRLRDALAVLLRKPADPDSPTGRSQERYRRVALSAVLAFAARSIQVVTGLVAVPLTVGFLGLERYGMWVTMSAMVAMLSFADLGIGNGLLNAIAEAHGRKDREAAARSVSSALAALSAVAGLLGLLFLVVYPRVNWAAVFNVSSPEAIAEAGPAVAVLVVSFLVSMPLGVAQRVRMGYQEGYVDSIWTAAGNVFAFLGVLLAIRLEASLPWLVGAMAGIPALVLLLNNAALYAGRYAWLRPRMAMVRRDTAVRIMGLGGYFLVLQVAAAVAYQSDSLILAQMLGPESVSQYAVPMKLFQLIPVVLGFAFAALWPVYGESFARGDHAWARLALKRSLRLAVALSVPMAVFLVIFGQPLIRLWVGEELVPDMVVLLAMALWAVVWAIGGAISAFLNGAGSLRFQAATAVVMMGVNVAISIALTARVGLSGVVWGSAIAEIACVLVPSGVHIRRMFSKDPQGG